MTSPMIHSSENIAIDAAEAIAAVLREALELRGSASLMVSGGSSPKPLYKHLSKVDLDWKNVTISLVDERWVNPGEPGSNEDFIRNNLIQNQAKSATFFGLKTKHKTVKAGLQDSEAKFSNIKTPVDVCVMGMGSDAHTASWFPNSKGLKKALSPNNENLLCSINATGAAVAGEFPYRISLTLRSVVDSHAIFLFIPGDAKRLVFQTASEKPLADAPVQALLDAGTKLHVFGSPAQ